MKITQLLGPFGIFFITFSQILPQPGPRLVLDHLWSPGLGDPIHCVGLHTVGLGTWKTSHHNSTDLFIIYVS